MDLVIAHVSKDYGRGPVLRDVSLTVRQGETVCLMGPSGLGKTTLLRCVAGLETRAVGRDDEGVDIRVADLARPADEVTVNEFAKLLCTRTGNQTEIGDCVLFGKEITRAKILFSHYRYSLLPSCVVNTTGARRAAMPHLLVL